MGGNRNAPSAGFYDALNLPTLTRRVLRRNSAGGVQDPPPLHAIRSVPTPSTLYYGSSHRRLRNLRGRRDGRTGCRLWRSRWRWRGRNDRGNGSGRRRWLRRRFRCWLWRGFRCWRLHWFRRGLWRGFRRSHNDRRGDFLQHRSFRLSLNRLADDRLLCRGFLQRGFLLRRRLLCRRLLQCWRLFSGGFLRGTLLGFGLFGGHSLGSFL